MKESLKSDSHLKKYINNSDWDSIGKIQSRTITIIELYRKVFKRDCLPDEKQYWTMCGAHFNRDGPLVGEFGHIIKDKLIKPYQFYGIDREKIIIDNNIKMYPDVKWIHGDFLEIIESTHLRGEFNPEIINYDGILQPKNGTKYLKFIMKFIDHNISNSLLLISNFILVNPYTYDQKYRYTIDNTIDRLKQIYWFPKHWNVIPQAYVYPGASKNNKTEMGMIMFVKEKHDINNIIY